MRFAADCEDERPTNDTVVESDGFGNVRYVFHTRNQSTTTFVLW